jgi:hypothetical protein
MEEALTQLGVGGIFVVLVLREVFTFVSKKRNGTGVDMLLVAKQVAELHRWHDREDEEGVKVWYVRKSLEDAVEKLAANIDKQTAIFQEMQQEQRAARVVLEALVKNVGK